MLMTMLMREMKYRMDCILLQNAPMRLIVIKPCFAISSSSSKLLSCWAALGAPALPCHHSFILRAYPMYCYA